jgi:hypothetical protein
VHFFQPLSLLFITKLYPKMLHPSIFFPLFTAKSGAKNFEGQGALQTRKPATQNFLMPLLSFPSYAQAPSENFATR